MAASLEKESTPHQHFSDDDTSDEDPGSSCKMTVKLPERCREILASGTCWRSWYVLVMFSHEADVNSTSHRGPWKMNIDSYILIQRMPSLIGILTGYYINTQFLWFHWYQILSHSQTNSESVVTCPGTGPYVSLRPPVELPHFIPWSWTLLSDNQTW